MQSINPKITAEGRRLARIFGALDTDEDLIWISLEEHEDVLKGTFDHKQLFNAVMAYL